MRAPSQHQYWMSSRELMQCRCAELHSPYRWDESDSRIIIALNCPMRWWWWYTTRCDYRMGRGSYKKQRGRWFIIIMPRLCHEIAVGILRGCDGDQRVCDFISDTRVGPGRSCSGTHRKGGPLISEKNGIPCSSLDFSLLDSHVRCSTRKETCLSNNQNKTKMAAKNQYYCISLYMTF